MSYKDGMKPMVAYKHPCYQIYIKTNIHLFIIILYYIILYYRFSTDIGHSPNYTAFGLPQTQQVR